MRAGIGLIGILLGVGLLVWLFANFSIPTAREGKKAQEKASQIAGYGQDSVPAAARMCVDHRQPGCSTP